MERSLGMSFSQDRWCRAQDPEEKSVSIGWIWWSRCCAVLRHSHHRAVLSQSWVWTVQHLKQTSSPGKAPNAGHIFIFWVSDSTLLHWNERSPRRSMEVLLHRVWIELKSKFWLVSKLGSSSPSSDLDLVCYPDGRGNWSSSADEPETCSMAFGNIHDSF